MTYNVFSGTLNPTHSLTCPEKLTDSQLHSEKEQKNSNMSPNQLCVLLKDKPATDLELVITSCAINTVLLCFLLYCIYLRGYCYLATTITVYLCNLVKI